MGTEAGEVMDQTFDETSLEFFASGTDVEEQIEFIEAKQQILKPVSSLMDDQENMYMAATALDSVQEHSSDENDDVTSISEDIWSEARAVLQKIKPQLRNAHGNQKNKNLKRSNETPKHPDIALEKVDKVDAEKYHGGVRVNSNFSKTLPSLPLAPHQWIATVLSRITPEPMSQEDWKVFSDPFAGAGLVPARAHTFWRNSIDMEEALTFSKRPRILAQAMPPFYTVFTNKAFLEATQGDSTIIGTPVEELIRVRTYFHPKMDAAPLYESLEACVYSKMAKIEMPCRIEITPVVNRSRRRRLNHDGYSVCLSHIMMDVVAMDSISLQHAGRALREATVLGTVG